MFKVDNDRLYTEQEIEDFGPLIQAMDRDEFILGYRAATSTGLKNVLALNKRHKDIIRVKLTSEPDRPLPPEIKFRLQTRKIDEVEVVS